MPLWFELAALMIAAYGAGIGIGWALWGRHDQQED
jgi:hypothetical protein|tara:strand:- start:253 stop:357 length:105 start_codon:yes stop_codon:yes gene_type:complete